jgi:hypothetical protein
MKPDRALVDRIATEEALNAHCTLAELLHMSARPEAKAARIRAWARIIAETGCTARQLAEAWGCCPETIWRAFPGPKAGRPGTERPKPPRPIYDADTVSRLQWRHGVQTAALIAAGRDPATEADRAAWAKLGGGR